MRKRVLVISPHTDDELLGCGGTLLKMMKNDEADIKLVVMSCSERYLRHIGRFVTENEQWNEFVKSSEYLSNTSPSDYVPAKLLTFTSSDRWRLEHESMHDVVQWLDRMIDEFQPTTVLIPEPSYHQEHRMVYDAAVAACRPTYGKSCIEKVMLYEIPTSTWSGATGIFKPNVYVDITNEIDEKVNVFKECYKVQYTETARNRLGDIGIRSHAQYRGIEIDKKYAEAFMLIRSLETSVA